MIEFQTDSDVPARPNGSSTQAQKNSADSDGSAKLLSLVASLLGRSERDILAMLQRRNTPDQDFFSMDELAERWRCSRGTVYNRLRKAGIELLDFSARGKKGRKAVPRSAILQLENQHMKRLR